MIFKLVNNFLGILFIFFFIVPGAFSSQPTEELIPTNEMKSNARCTSLSIQINDDSLAEKHKIAYFSGAYVLGGITDENINNAYYYHFGRSEGFISATASFREQKESAVAAEYYKLMKCKDLINKNITNAEFSGSAFEISERTNYVKNLRKKYSNLILFVEDKSEDYVSIYLGFDEGQGRRTRYGFLRVNGEGEVYRNKDPYLGVDNWVLIK